MNMRLFKTKTSYRVMGYELKSNRLSVVCLEKKDEFLFGKPLYTAFKCYLPDHSTIWRYSESGRFVSIREGIQEIIEAYDASLLAISLGAQQ
jgi:hypothetical protein